MLCPLHPAFSFQHCMAGPCFLSVPALSPGLTTCTQPPGTLLTRQVITATAHAVCKGALERRSLNGLSMAAIRRDLRLATLYVTDAHHLKVPARNVDDWKHNFSPFGRINFGYQMVGRAGSK